MDYEESLQEAARRAEAGVKRSIEALQDRHVRREDDLTGVLKGNLDAELRGRIRDLRWTCSIIDHGPYSAALEQEFGADILIHVKVTSSDITYSKGLLVHGKRLEAGELMSPSEHRRLVEQCNKMLRHSPASYVWSYSNSGMRCGSALVIAGSTSRDLNDQCVWTSYRFFLELFRCPIGDHNIVSPYPEDLRIKKTVQMFARDLRD